MSKLKEVLSVFPTIRHCFAYGSGVFHQPQLYAAGQAARPMLDFIFAVESPVEWHRKNIERNPGHYSFLANFGARAVNLVAERVGVGVHFNPMVKVHDQEVKYGVVGVRNLLADLRQWQHLYVAGRMHKPVLTLQQDADVAAAADGNLRSALAAALLMLGDRFTSQEMFEAVARLSYTGDVRNGAAEDPLKVQRIVQGSLARFRELYHSHIQGQLGQVAGLQQQQSEVWSQDLRQDARLQLLALLPQAIQQRMAQKVGLVLPQPLLAAPDALPLLEVGASEAAEDGDLAEAQKIQIAHKALTQHDHRKLLSSAVASIVSASSRRQALSGFLAAGPIRSAQYLGRKLRKAWRLDSWGAKMLATGGGLSRCSGTAGTLARCRPAQLGQKY